jgi:hypothetical protein
MYMWVCVCSGISDEIRGRIGSRYVVTVRVYCHSESGLSSKVLIKIRKTQNNFDLCGFKIWSL